MPDTRLDRRGNRSPANGGMRIAEEEEGVVPDIAFQAFKKGLDTRLED